jgi:multidrug efflux pump subunit AcrA (membrane-fusion protein)
VNYFDDRQGMKEQRYNASLELQRELREQLSALRAENDRLRAALANSQSPCVYCSLPKEQWAECKSGFPGCGRSDDAMGCPELGASLEADALRAERDRLRDAMQHIARVAGGVRINRSDVRTNETVVILEVTMIATAALAESQLRQKPNTDDVPAWCRAAAEHFDECIGRDTCPDGFEHLSLPSIAEHAAIIARHAKEAK